MANEKYLPFFVYGTLRHGFNNYAWALSGKVRQIRKASTIGTMYSLGGFPALVNKGENDIVGELMLVEPEHYDKVLESLDMLEGYHKYDEDPKETSMYLRKEADVLDDLSGETVKAWVYYWNRPTDRLPVIATGDWALQEVEGRHSL
ncbi:gamma-glutamyl cyclotransferase [Bacillus phage 031MP004]|nr:gamma-glutamyl cyclotransferase [Bacillus phage 031MP004]